MRGTTRLLGALTGALVLVAATAGPAAATDPPVTLVVGTDGTGATQAIAELGERIVSSSGDLDAVTIEVPASRAATISARLESAPGVAFVEPEHEVRAQVVPSDTYWNNQWGARRIGAPAAWDVTTGAASTVIAVLDTGVDPGPEFDGKLTAGYDFVEEDADPADDNGHGTAVAAIAAADANDGGVAGICWTCRIMPVKVLGADGSGGSYDIARGITWAAERGADVIVLSLGSPNPSSVFTTAVAQARAAGAVVVAAAGNAGTSAPNYPAATDGVVGVAASNESDLRYPFSSYGSWVDVAAPGCNGAPLSGSYDWFCGTSSATPVAGGAAALALSRGATGTQVEQALAATASPLVGGWVSAGRVDAAALVASVPPAPAGTGSGSGTTTGGSGTTTGGGGTTTDPEPEVDEDPTDDGTGTVDRVAGDDRIGSSLAIARRAHPDGAETVVLARADAYADALAAAPLAASLGAPVLLTGSSGARADVLSTVRSLGARAAVLVGGAGALSDQVRQDLVGAGVTEVRRIAGDDRFDTARRIALEVGGSAAYVVEGASTDAARGWPDAVAVSALAAQQGRPILLTARDSLPPATEGALAALDVASITVIGGTGAVSASVTGRLGTFAPVDRVAGATRYDTSARLADAALADGGDGATVWVATGRSWPDALAAGASAGAAGAVLLLVDGTDLTRSPESAAWLTRRAAGLRDVVLVGGTGTIAPTVESALSALV